MENQFTLLTEFQYSSEAFICKGKLESSGIPVFMRDQHTVDTNPMLSTAIGGVKLYVNSEDYDRAREILSEISRLSIDDSGHLMKCPNCGAQKSELVTTIKDTKTLLAFLFSILFVLIPFYAKHTYRCLECKFEFTQK